MPYQIWQFVCRKRQTVVRAAREPPLPEKFMSENNEPIGYIVGGGLKEGFRIRLTVPADRVQEGSFVVCENGRFHYYGLITDLQLGSTDPRFADEKSDRLQPAIQQAPCWAKPSTPP